MPLNTGVTGSYVGAGSGGGVLIEFFYDPVLTAGEVIPENQPIRNVGGVAMRVTNTTGRVATLRVEGPSGPLLGQDGTRDVDIPVTGRTATANQLRNLAGIETRADITNFTMSSPADALRKP